MIGLPPQTPIVRAYQWWCGDDECDCTQFRVELWIPRGVGYAWDTKALWSGRFTSPTYEESRGEHAERLWEFRRAAREHGVRLRSNDAGIPSGQRPA